MIRVLLGIALVVFLAGFIYFAGNVIYLGTKEFFSIYGKNAKKDKQEVNKGKTTNETSARKP